MMDRLLNWIGNILFFLMFLTIIENLLPGKKYNRYIRLFAGMVLILLIAEPVVKGLHLEERMAYYFESISFQQDAKDLSKEILGVEKQRLSQIMDQYEQTVETDLNTLTVQMGYVPVSVQVTIDKDADSETYGTVVHIGMEVEKQDMEEEALEKQAVQAVSPVETVTVHVAGQEKVQEPAVIKQQERERAGSESQGNRELEELRRKVESYYGLETGKVEIQFQGKQGSSAGTSGYRTDFSHSGISSGE